jgi:hypothetical protein
MQNSVCAAQLPGTCHIEPISSDGAIIMYWLEHVRVQQHLSAAERFEPTFVVLVSSCCDAASMPSHAARMVESGASWVHACSPLASMRAVPEHRMALQQPLQVVSQLVSVT